MSINEYYTNHVSQIFTSVIEALQENPSRKFNHAEIMFFSLWWKEQSDEMKETVR